MTAPVAFNSYLGWVNVADPLNIPADVRVISADDLLRYEHFGDAAETAINELITTTQDQGTEIGQLQTGLGEVETLVSQQGTTLGQHGTTLADHTTDIADLTTALSGVTGLTGKDVYSSKAFDLTVAGGVKTLATVTAGSSYTSFEVEVTLVGRNAAGPVYVKAVRYIRPENGNPQYLVVGADTISGTIAIAFTASGTSGINITATATVNDAFLTAHVAVKAGAGASTGAARTVTLAMA